LSTAYKYGLLYQSPGVRQIDDHYRRRLQEEEATRVLDTRPCWFSDCTTDSLVRTGYRQCPTRQQNIQLTSCIGCPDSRARFYDREILYTA